MTRRALWARLFGVGAAVAVAPHVVTAMPTTVVGMGAVVREYNCVGCGWRLMAARGRHQFMCGNAECPRFRHTERLPPWEIVSYRADEGATA